MRLDALARLGYSAYFAEQRADDRARPMRVVVEHRDKWRVTDGEDTSLVTLLGTLRDDPERRPVVGDWVLVAEGRVCEVLDRRTAFVRRAPGKRIERQVIAANVDVVFVVTSLDVDLNPRRLERYLATVWESGARPVLVLSKADLVEDAEVLVSALGAIGQSAPIVVTSRVAGLGLDALEAHLGPGVSVALVGSSGVGKSTLVNWLLGAEAQAVAPLRDDGKGRHTTTHRELIVLPGERGILIDTPGMRELAIWEADMDATFPEIEALAAACRFGDCAHDAEPGCAVRAALESGELAEDRFESWRKLSAELRGQPESRSPRRKARR